MAHFWVDDVTKMVDERFKQKELTELITKEGRENVTKLLVAWDNYRYKMSGTNKDARHSDFMDTLE